MSDDGYKYIRNVTIKLRKMNIGELIFLEQTPAIKKLVRDIDKVNKKISSCKTSLVFNRTCITENILPTFTNTYIQGL